MKVFEGLPPEVCNHILQGAQFKTVAFPESQDPRIIAAAKTLKDEFQVDAILCEPDIVAKNAMQTANVISLQAQKRNKPLPTNVDALSHDVFFCAGGMLAAGKVDAVVGGAVAPTAQVIKAALGTVGLSEKSSLITSAFLFSLPKPTDGGENIVLFSDCAVVPDPTAQQLSEIAFLAAQSFKSWTNLEPRVAFLSFSTEGSAKHASVEKVALASSLFKSRFPEIVSQGEIQFDAAVVPDIAARKSPAGPLGGHANVFVFPDLNSGNISYKITQRLGQAQAWGPVLMGTARPFSDLSRGSSHADIVQIALLTLAMGG